MNGFKIKYLGNPGNPMYFDNVLLNLGLGGIVKKQKIFLLSPLSSFYPFSFLFVVFFYFLEQCPIPISPVYDDFMGNGWTLQSTSMSVDLTANPQGSYPVISFLPYSVSMAVAFRFSLLK